MYFSTAVLGCLLLTACAGNTLSERDLSFRATADFGSYGDCKSAEWPPSEVGDKLVPQAPDDELKEMLAEMSSANVESIIEKLVSFGTRHTLSTQNSTTQGIGAARDWIASEMRKYAEESDGRMTVTVPGYTQGVGNRIPFPVKISNVLATIKGSEDPDRVYVMTGHYDSRVTDVLDYTSDAPGANDDASGTAVAMEIARVLAKRKPKSTIILGAVAGEEQGLYGSTFFAQTLKNASTNVEGMLNCDIVGSSTGDRGQKDPELARFSSEVAANKATEMNIAIIYRLDRFLRGGDHSPFLQAGYPAIRYTEPNENFAHQHQDLRTENGTVYGDLIEFVDFEYTARVGKVNLATLWSLSQAPGIVRNVTVDTTALDNNTRLKWVIKDTPDLAGYEIVWRSTTAPLWTHVLDVGKVDTVTIPLSKDNVIFGVRAVGTNGYKSPATYPFPG